MKYIIMPNESHDTILCEDWSQVTWIMKKETSAKRQIKEIDEYAYHDLKMGGRQTFEEFRKKMEDLKE